MGLALACAAALAAVALLVPATPAAPPAAGRGSAFLGPARTTALPAAGRQHLRTATWWGRVYTTSTGESLAVSISDSYPADDAAGQAWANTFASFLHGTEFSLLHVYVATPSEVETICGPSALGCYGGNQLVTIGEPAYGVDPLEVATHEYGHHVAFNRLNTPWAAVDWGPKRWASQVGVCTRAAAGTAYPGDESVHYTLNPGEAFAEVYRAVNQARAGFAIGWALVDSSFFPDPAALKAAEEDVVHPWSAPPPTTVRARFTAHGRKVWNLSLPTPLDGLVEATLSIPKGGLYNLSLLAPDGKTVLAGGLWTGTTQKKLTYTVCGQRALSLRVSRVGAAGRFTLSYSRP